MVNSFDLSEKRVLLVDDNLADIDILKRTLKAEGYKIAFANNGKTALEIVEHKRPDLILMDILMPGIDGFETFSLLKERELTKEIPVIFITGKTNSTDIVRGFGLGGIDYIVKPYQCEEVCARVKTHLMLATAQKQLNEQNKELIKHNNLKNTFIGVAAHDLRNPLTAVCGLAQLMMMKPDDISTGEIKQYSEQIHLTGKRMLYLVNELLNVAEIESGHLKLDLQSCSLKNLILERIQLFEINAKQKGIEIDKSLDEIDDVFFDPNYISQVIDNLISNAIKFSEFNKKIFVTLRQEVLQARVCVEDEGPGISEKDKKSLFGFFKKLSAKPTGGENSTGLGLSISKRIVEEHGGTINAESEIGSGATFCFFLPIGNKKI